MEIERNNQAPNISNKIFGAPREVIEQFSTNIAYFMMNNKNIHWQIFKYFLE